MRSPPPPSRRIARPTAVVGTLAVGTLGVLTFVALPAAAQRPPDQIPTTGFSLWVDAIAAAVVTLLVGGGFVALAPDYTERTTDRVLETPGETFLYGLGIFVAAVVVIFLLAITVVGIVLVVPLVIALVVVGELGYLAAGRAVTDDWGQVLLIAIVVSAIAGGVPYLGGFVGFVLGCLGAGAWYLDYRHDGSSYGDGTVSDPSYSGSSGGSTTGGDVTEEWGTGNTPQATGDASGDDDEDPGIRAALDSDTDDGTGSDDSGSGDSGSGDPGDEWTAGFDDEDRG